MRDHFSAIFGVGLALKSQSFSKPHRQFVADRNDRWDRHIVECSVEPVERCTRSFQGVALALGIAGQDPSHFGFACDGRLHVALEVEEADVADGLAIGLPFDGPQANSKNAPEARAGHCPPPSILAHRRTADEAGNLFVGMNEREIVRISDLWMANRRRSVRKVGARVFLSSGS